MKLRKQSARAIGAYLAALAGELEISYLDPVTRRPEPGLMRTEIGRLRRWAKMLRASSRESGSHTKPESQ